VETAQANVEALKAQVEAARIAVDTAQVNLGYTRITSPIDGQVVAIVTEEGTTVNANQSAPTILIVAQVDTMTVKASISEADVTSVKPGQQVYFTILGEPDRRWHTTLRSIEPATDSISTSSTSSTSSSSTSTTSATAIYYNGKLDVPNPDHLLRISMTATVHIVRSAARNALTIPAGALGPRGRPDPGAGGGAGRPAAAAPGEDRHQQQRQRPGAGRPARRRAGGAGQRRHRASANGGGPGAWARRCSDAGTMSTQTQAAPLLDLRGVGRDFPAGEGTLTVLQDIDLQIHAGEMVAIVGQSGSGKSTLMNLLGCLDQASRGRYAIAGREVAQLSPDELAELRREHFGFIFQRYHLLSDLTAQGNVEVPAVYAGLPAAERHAARRPCCSAWAWATAPSTCRASSPAASSSGCPSPAR
jgi:ABC-type multidrug transport system fused ATPase/permease subunit